MKNNLEIMKNFVLNCWYSSWMIAIRWVVSQWITGIVLILVGIWIVQSLFSFSITRIFDFFPESVRLFINQNIHGILTAGIYGIAFAIVIQVLSKHKHYEELSNVIELQFDSDKSFDERLKICEFEIILYEGRKEILLHEKDIINSCSPIPIVTALLGYAVEKIGLTSFNWQIYIIICIFIILTYVFLCLRNIRKFKDNQQKIHRWQNAKVNIELQRKDLTGT